MSPDMQRRDFLKLLSLIPVAYRFPKSTLSSLPDGSDANYIVIIFDSWTAANTSLYGYPRDTTPNISRLAENAIVYHNHYAAGHFTYPSTSSFLTGVLPWTHKGFYSNTGQELLKEFHTKNIFRLFESHQRFCYTNNLLANSIIQHMDPVIDFHQPPYELSLSKNTWYDELFSTDSDTAILSWVRAMRSAKDGYSNTLLLSRIYEYFKEKFDQKLIHNYPRGIPEQTGKLSFLLETAIDWTIDQIKQQTNPFLGYIHLLPPHDPYRTRIDFYNVFKNDGFLPTPKDYHPLATTGLTHDDQLIHRQEYDEYLLFIDTEFGRLMNAVKRNADLKNTWIILTSDHGEMFERGIPNHETPSFHQPLMHIPLLIFPPGQTERLDIYNPTSTIDLLPTLLHLTNKPFPNWLEGEVLPPFNVNSTPHRSIYSLDGRYTPQLGPYKNGTFMLRKDEYKLTYFFGKDAMYSKLNGEPYYELYNLEEDPEELENLYHPDDRVSKEMFDEMITKAREMKIYPD
jgi:arylsulfatase A-like enzyme